MQQLHPNSEKLILEARDDNTSPKRLSELAQIDPTLTRLVAANPNANPELLADLANTEDEEIQRALVANPNTPREVLWKLGEDFPQEVLDNPVFSLLLIENPNLVETIPEYTLRSFLVSSRTPISFIKRAAAIGTYYLNLGLTVNPQTPEEVLKKLVKSQNKLVREAAQLHVNFPEKVPEELEALIGDPIKALLDGVRNLNINREDWEFAAEIGIIPLVFFEYLANHKKPLFRCRVAQSYLGSDVASATLRERLLEKLAGDFEPHVRKMVARNPHAPVKVLERLAKDENLHVQTNLARNPNAPGFLLEELGQDSNARVRLGVAENLNAPTTVFEKLAKDRNREVRDRVARNPSIPVYLLEELETDAELVLAVACNVKAPAYLLEKMAGSKLERYPKLRMLLAQNPNTPSYLLEKFALDKDSNVRAQVARNPNTPGSVLEELALSQEERIREIVARNLNLPINSLEELAGDNSDRVRGAIASHPNTAIDILEKLAREQKFRIRVSVASNKHTPVRLLEELGQDSKLHREVAANPSAPFYLLEKLLGSLIGGLKLSSRTLRDKMAIKRFLAEKPDGLPLLLELWAENLELFSSSSLLVFSHLQVPPGVLAKNCRSLAWLERLAIGRNPRTPRETLHILAQDGNRLVRAGAKVNLGDREAKEKGDRPSNAVVLRELKK